MNNQIINSLVGIAMVFLTPLAAVLGKKVGQKAAEKIAEAEKRKGFFYKIFLKVQKEFPSDDGEARFQRALSMAKSVFPDILDAPLEAAMRAAYEEYKKDSSI